MVDVSKRFWIVASMPLLVCTSMLRGLKVIMIMMITIMILTMIAIKQYIHTCMCMIYIYIYIYTYILSLSLSLSISLSLYIYIYIYIYIYTYASGRSWHAMQGSPAKRAKRYSCRIDSTDKTKLQGCYLIEYLENWLSIPLQIRAKMRSERKGAIHSLKFQVLPLRKGL